MTTVEVLQYVPPQGRTKWQSTDLEKDLETEYESMNKASCRLEAKVRLSEKGFFSEVSLTVFHRLKQEDIDIEVVENGPAVQKAIERLLERKIWTKLPEKPKVDL